MFRSVVVLFLFILCLLMAPSHSTFAQDSLGIGTVEYADTQIAVMSGVVGDPIKDTFVDDDGLPIDVDPTVDTILDKERKIIEAAGYEWDETIPGWKVPDGHVWDDVQKKWVHA
jgi:hypothetical protein